MSIMTVLNVADISDFFSKILNFITKYVINSFFSILEYSTHSKDQHTTQCRQSDAEFTW